MIEGESGIKAICPPGERPQYRASLSRLDWPNGAKSLIFTADEPERLRGKQHMKLWCDELASWRYPDAWDQASLGLRLGDNPQIVITTTPKPTQLIRDLAKNPLSHVTFGTSYENRANLAPQFFEEIISKYEGTRLGRQELNAEILEDIEGALWQRSWIDATRVASIKPRDLQRIVVAIDPAVTNTEDSDDTGIVVAAKGSDGRGYVLDDATCRMSPDGWASRAIGVFRDRSADRVIAEVNNGGDLVERVLRTVDPKIPYRAVHASRGKITRAEPIAALYEQGKISHVGSFPQLEDEMCTYTGLPGEKSPNRMDALVWALSELFLEAQGKPRMLWV
jgi:predicted phage terminase large subunit-like protein